MSLFAEPTCNRDHIMELFGLDSKNKWDKMVFDNCMLEMEDTADLLTTMELAEDKADEIIDNKPEWHLFGHRYLSTDEEVEEALKDKLDDFLDELETRWPEE